MSMNVLARRHYYRRQRSKKREAEQARELGSLLRAAAHKFSQVKGRNPINVDDLSLSQQVTLLERYASRLQLDLDDFISTWGEDGKDGAAWLRAEIHRALSHVARLKIREARGEEPARIG
jgi:hypothetical protein